MLDPRLAAYLADDARWECNEWMRGLGWTPELRRSRFIEGWNAGYNPAMDPPRQGQLL